VETEETLLSRQAFFATIETEVGEKKKNLFAWQTGFKLFDIISQHYK
jgi:hypothetical protein